MYCGTKINKMFFIKTFLVIFLKKVLRFEKMDGWSGKGTQYLF